jgi:hypothetical protein
MENYTLRLSNHLTGNSGQKRIVIECSDYLTFESVAIYKESDPKVKHAEQIVETLNNHCGKQNYFLVSDSHNAMGILAFGELKTEAQKDDFVAKLLQIITDHYSCDDCGINSIEDFVENYFDGTNGIYGSHLWYSDIEDNENGGKYENLPFTIEKLPLY